MKEYQLENGPVDLNKLKADQLDKATYAKAHEGLIIACHDIFVQYNNGILLVKRLSFPAKGILWPLGGRIKRGIPTEQSAREKIEEESGLKTLSLIEIGHARTFFATEPFNHGHGTDSINIIYFAKTEGKLKLNSLHEEPTIVTPAEYQKLRASLHPYVRDFMDKAIQLVK